MATQPETSPDPFRWAREYNNDMQRQAAQDKQSADNMLAQMFQTEARRQAPWAELPVDLAKMNVSSNLSLRNQMQMSDYNARNQRINAVAKSLNVPPAQVGRMIEGVAKMYGEDPDLMLSIADVESNFRNVPNAAGSSAAGLYQFMPETAKQYGLANPYDMRASAEAAARLIRDNRAKLQQAGIKDVTPAMIYFAHQQGASGAAKVLANPTGSAVATLGRRAVQANGGTADMTNAQFFAKWAQKFDPIYNQRVTARNKNKQTDPLAAFRGDENMADQAKAILQDETNNGDDS